MKGQDNYTNPKNYILDQLFIYDYNDPDDLDIIKMKLWVLDGPVTSDDGNLEDNDYNNPVNHFAQLKRELMFLDRYIRTNRNELDQYEEPYDVYKERAQKTFEIMLTTENPKTGNLYRDYEIPYQIRPTTLQDVDFSQLYAAWTTKYNNGELQTAFDIIDKATKYCIDDKIIAQQNTIDSAKTPEEMHQELLENADKQFHDNDEVYIDSLSKLKSEMNNIIRNKFDSMIRYPEFGDTYNGTRFSYLLDYEHNRSNSIAIHKNYVNTCCLNVDELDRVFLDPNFEEDINHGVPFSNGGYAQNHGDLKSCFTKDMNLLTFFVPPDMMGLMIDNHGYANTNTHAYLCFKRGVDPENGIKSDSYGRRISYDSFEYLLKCPGLTLDLGSINFPHKRIDWQVRAPNGYIPDHKRVTGKQVGWCYFYFFPGNWYLDHKDEDDHGGWSMNTMSIAFYIYVRKSNIFREWWIKTRNNTSNNIMIDSLSDDVYKTGGTIVYLDPGDICYVEGGVTGGAIKRLSYHSLYVNEDKDILTTRTFIANYVQDRVYENINNADSTHKGSPMIERKGYKYTIQQYPFFDGDLNIFRNYSDMFHRWNVSENFSTNTYPVYESEEPEVDASKFLILDLVNVDYSDDTEHPDDQIINFQEIGNVNQLPPGNSNKGSVSKARFEYVNNFWKTINNLREFKIMNTGTRLPIELMVSAEIPDLRPDMNNHLQDLINEKMFITMILREKTTEFI